MPADSQHGANPTANEAGPEPVDMTESMRTDSGMAYWATIPFASAPGIGALTAPVSVELSRPWLTITPTADGNWLLTAKTRMTLRTAEGCASHVMTATLPEHNPEDGTTEPDPETRWPIVVHGMHGRYIGHITRQGEGWEYEVIDTYAPTGFMVVRSGGGSDQADIIHRCKHAIEISERGDD